MGYYKMQLPNGEVSDGHTDPAWQWDNYRLPKRVDGLKVYDYGTWDGGIAIEAAKRGAREVWGLDSFVWEMWPETKRAFDKHVAALAPSVQHAYVETEPVPRRRFNAQTAINTSTKMNIEAFGNKHGTADIVVAAGVFYHLMNPLKFIEDLTCLMGPVSRLYMTTFCLKDIRHPDPIMRFAYGWNGDNTNYWLASVSCVMQMLQYAGLNLIERYQVLPGTDQHPEPLIMFHARKA
jgi:hypothetical protein